MDIELVKTEANSSASFNQSAEYTKINPLGKIPAFEGANGFVLSEVIALVVYGMYLKKFLVLLKSLPPLYDECFILLVIPVRITNNYVENPPTLKFLLPRFQGRFFFSHGIVCEFCVIEKLEANCILK